MLRRFRLGQSEKHASDARPRVSFRSATWKCFWPELEAQESPMCRGIGTENAQFAVFNTSKTMHSVYGDELCIRYTKQYVIIVQYLTKNHGDESEIL
jgi:hypothetical protein